MAIPVAIDFNLLEKEPLNLSKPFAARKIAAISIKIWFFSAKDKLAAYKNFCSYQNFPCKMLIFFFCDRIKFTTNILYHRNFFASTQFSRKIFKIQIFVLSQFLLQQYFLRPIFKHFKNNLPQKAIYLIVIGEVSNVKWKKSPVIFCHIERTGDYILLINENLMFRVQKKKKILKSLQFWTTLNH